MEKINCRRCQREIDVEDHFCRHCGQQLKPLKIGELAAVQIVPEPKPKRLSPSDNPWLVLVMLFFVFGPFALPMLWQSRAFTHRGKWIWTLIVLLYTAFLCWLLWFITVKMIVEPLQKLRF